MRRLYDQPPRRPILLKTEVDISNPTARSAALHLRARSHSHRRYIRPASCRRRACSNPTLRRRHRHPLHGPRSMEEASASATRHARRAGPRPRARWTLCQLMATCIPVPPIAPDRLLVRRRLVRGMQRYPRVVWNHSLYTGYWMEMDMNNRYSRCSR